MACLVAMSSWVGRTGILFTPTLKEDERSSYGNVVCSDISVASGLLLAIVSYIFLCIVLGSLLISRN